ncbi:hypothetical protein PENSPDRAFT_663195 [Peniophora sp. CONT]|nr:hypothetical protein PENSPDRAFT_663195 [Peniophora sp. CONT]
MYAVECAGLSAPACIRAEGVGLATEEDRSLYMTLMGILMCTRGLGNVLSTPLATALSSGGSGFNATAAVHTGFAVAGGKYKDMIVYVGSCFAAAAVIAVVGLGREWVVKKRATGQ